MPLFRSCPLRNLRPRHLPSSSPTALGWFTLERTPEAGTAVIASCVSPIGKVNCLEPSPSREPARLYIISCSCLMGASRELLGAVCQGRDSAASTKLQENFPATRSALPWKVLVVLLVTAQPLDARHVAEAGAFSAGRQGPRFTGGHLTMFTAMLRNEE